MPSPYQKIIDLINSSDPEIEALGNLTLIAKLNKSNAIYYYLALYNKLNSDASKKLTEIIGWNATEMPITNFENIFEYLKKNITDDETINKFIDHYSKSLIIQIKYSFKSKK
jgi:hypothetical protein